MFTPTTIPYFTQFYPIGNTPAASLTRGLPQGLDADILLLGCGDVRDILFTAYSERGFLARKLDITCCDIETAIIARNVLLFTLLVDDISADSAWEIYFHFRIDDSSKKVIKDQAQKLLCLSDNLDQWSEGRYGSMLRFCDGKSLQEVRQVWMKYALDQPKTNASFEKDFENTRRLLRLMNGPSERIINGLRSAAPLSLSLRGQVLEANELFWKYGSLSKHPGTVPNPLFSESMSTDNYLHYGTNPILGFHLATAKANLATGSPLYPEKDHSEILDVTAAAKTQFREWVAAFREISETRITLRFTVSDALSFGHALQAISNSRGSSTCLFRRQFDATPIEFDPKAYATLNSTPTRFDMIDTSNLADSLGALNLLLAAAPLLKESASSTLWMETLIRTEKTQNRPFDALLPGHALTISLLLGLSPVEYWTNATSVSYVDEIIVNSMGSSTDAQQAYSRLSWKRSTSFSHLPSGLETLTVVPNTLANVVFQAYLEMFENEDGTPPLEASQQEMAIKFLRHKCPLFHRGSFVLLIKYIQKNISTAWPSFWENLLKMIDQDNADKNTMRRLYRHELGAQLHVQGLYTESWMKKLRPIPSAGSFNAWKNIPEVVCVTVVVPRKHVDSLRSTKEDELNAPTFEGVLRLSGQLGWEHFFSGVHAVFGQVETSGERESESFSIAIRQDPQGWQGKSPLIAFFYVPTTSLQAEPEDTRVGLRFRDTPVNVRALKHLLPNMGVYETGVKDTSNVFITKYEPGMNGYPLATSYEDPIVKNAAQTDTQTDTFPSARITANFEDGKVTSLCNHIDFSSPETQKLLTEHVPIQLRQSSPFSIDIVFGNGLLVHIASFPAPVLKETAKTRIARKSCYIEVIAPLADPLASEPLSSFIYPITLGENSVPIPLNNQQVNLDYLPILDVDEAYKKENRWLETLASHQFSVRERRLRESSELPSLRMEFKESLFSIFMLASGLQGGNTGLFALQNPVDGIQILIFVRAIRINGAEGSVVADAAVLPITRQLIDSGEIETFLYILRELQICSIDVNDEELVLWKKVLPALAERCRTWSHGPDCEYKKPRATIPLSTEMGKQFMCSCGNGKLPEGFMNLPEWEDAASKHAIRVAISPTFSVPFVENIVDLDLLKAQGSLERLHMDKCRNCNATEAKNGKNLLKCSRCKEVMYCSSECQRADWKKHRMECKPYDDEL
ncbi:uncharacterized protein F4812DRAFT_462259 [Daldinia caldariorum]|uniref:uncharacterized protein n=1 Tax=Daldinia caldariorum TaxID=326644 RepID=UPI0020076014|nr:uncharacterized protein F4812DRAFT_462259 [Daldinia caldariorum]KAI1464937.1 hypothetical protein F4812DRAFT_462259 [Daldinia caldariorum]